MGAPDESLTRFSGLVAVTELTDRLGVIDRLDAAVGPIKTRDRGFTAGQVLVGIAAVQLCGEDFLVGLDRHRADRAGQVLTPVPVPAATTATGLARRLSQSQWAAVETGLGDVHATALDLLDRSDPDRAQALSTDVTIDLDTTDVEVYGRLKQGVAFNHQGQRVGRPHVATWADTSVVLAADLGDGRDDPRATSAELLGRALAALPARARAARIRVRADAGYFAGQLARAALFTGVEFAIGARRTAPLWRVLDGVPADGWTDAIGSTGTRTPEATLGPLRCPTPGSPPEQHQHPAVMVNSATTRGFGSDPTSGDGPELDAIATSHDVVIMRKEYITDTSDAGENRGGAAVAEDSLYLDAAEHWSSPLHTKAGAAFPDPT